MPAFAVLKHMRHESLQAVQDAVEVDAEHPVPLGTGQFPDCGVDGAGAGHPGVVAKDVHLAEGVYGPLGQVEDAFPDHGVDRHADDLGLALPKLLHRPVQGILLDVGEHHPHSGGSEPFGQREADAAGGTGHHGGLASEVLHSAVPFVGR